MDNYYAIIKIQVTGKDFEDVVGLGECVVDDIKNLTQYPNLIQASLEAVGKNNPLYLDINPLLEE